MNSEKTETSDSHRLLFNVTDKINLKRSNAYFLFSNFSIYYTWRNIKKSYKNNKFKILAPAYNEELELPDASYCLSGIQDYFEYILKKHGDETGNPSIRKYVNK